MMIIKWFFVVILFVLHIFLMGWGLVGFAEWLLPKVPWTPISNPNFPSWVLFLHWMAIFSGGSIFITGYVLRWHYTVTGMVFAYGLMASMCAIETFGYMTSQSKYWAMIAEYITYLAILIFLHLSPFFRERFSSLNR